MIDGRWSEDAIANYHCFKGRSLAYATVCYDTLPFLHKQKVHCCIAQNQEDATVYAQANGIIPQGKSVEAEGAEDGRAWNLDIKTVLVIDQR